MGHAKLSCDMSISLMAYRFSTARFCTYAVRGHQENMSARLHSGCCPGTRMGSWYDRPQSTTPFYLPKTSSLGRRWFVCEVVPARRGLQTAGILTVLDLGLLWAQACHQYHPRHPNKEWWNHIKLALKYQCFCLHTGIRFECDCEGLHGHLNVVS